MLSSLLRPSKHRLQTKRASLDTVDAQDAQSRRFVRLSDGQGRLERYTELNGHGSIEGGRIAEGQLEEEDGDIEGEEEEEEEDVDEEDDEAAPLLPIFSAAHLGTL